MEWNYTNSELRSRMCASFSAVTTFPIKP